MDKSLEIDSNKITRVEVIERGVNRWYVNNNTKVEDVQLQDDGRTLKVFIVNKHSRPLTFPPFEVK